MTRKQLKAVLEKSGIEMEGYRLQFIIMNAELRGLICSGARRGRQHTYALLEERAPNALSLSPDESLAELTLRYFTSHGPATIKDFGWWDIKRGLDMVGSQLTAEEIEGVTYWFSGPASVPEPDSPKVALLQTFDEYVVAYKDSRSVIDASGLARPHDATYLLADAVLLDSQMVGIWKRIGKMDEVLIEVELYAPLDESQTRALNASTSEFSEFLELRAPSVTSVTPPKTG